MSVVSQASPNDHKSTTIIEPIDRLNFRQQFDSDSNQGRGFMNLKNELVKGTAEAQNQIYLP